MKLTLHATTVGIMVYPASMTRFGAFSSGGNGMLSVLYNGYTVLNFVGMRSLLDSNGDDFLEL
jgi:hypothetical protein